MGEVGRAAAEGLEGAHEPDDVLLRLDRAHIEDEGPAVGLPARNSERVLIDRVRDDIDAALGSAVEGGDLPAGELGDAALRENPEITLTTREAGSPVLTPSG